VSQSTSRDRPILAAVPPAPPVYRWFRIGILILLALSLAFRLWGIERFNTLVFDEVYYAKFAQNYLTQTPFFDGHPPLSKYLIALSLAIGKRLPFPQEPINAMLGAPYASWNYRWLNAVLGATIPLIILGFTYSLTQRRTTALIAGGLAFLDGMLLVESRYALNNIHLLLFGLLGLWALLLALDRGWVIRLFGSIFSGVCFGLATAIKWNGLWFLLAAYGIWIVGVLVQWVAPELLQSGSASSQGWSSPGRSKGSTPESAHDAVLSPIAQFTQLNLWQILTFAIILPVSSTLTYILTWIPHLQLNVKEGFWKDFWMLQTEILTYHQRVGNGAGVHTYCSNWYSWLVMWRPVAYFYKVTDRGAPVPGDYVPPPSTSNLVIYDVHSMGNPFLWWFSTLVIGLTLGLVAWMGLRYASYRWSVSQSGSRLLRQSLSLPFSATDRGILLVLAIAYLANLLPWTRVTRCTFLYHYMGAAVFATIALAWFCDRGLRSESIILRRFAIAVLGIITLAFIFWLPLYLGLPLSPQEFTLRMWLRSWV
jgi:dolichyl-phosphate-mannose-protein mannosyltransferase